jgi:hypothetical protein
MQFDQHDGLPSVPTALVVDDSFAARARVTTLLHLGGWRVHHAVGTEDALRLADSARPSPGKRAADKSRTAGSWHWSD